jgi:acyl carrier protein
VDDLRSWLIAAAGQLAPGFAGIVSLDTPLVEDGLCLDSVALLELIAALEARTGVKISEDDITETNFGTIGRLLDFVSARV